MTQSGGSISIDQAINSRCAQPIDHIGLAVRQSIDELPSASVSEQNTALVKATHDGQDRRVGVVPAVRASEVFPDLANACLAARGDFTNDRCAQRAKHVFENRITSHRLRA
ncbi:MAG TPA: hypothetical protein VGQ02_04105 [Candidatus Limnocylindrales bacterium]|nr:hypothetical protein [Candidatus Limnocylindrales bacterium]